MTGLDENLIKSFGQLGFTEYRKIDTSEIIFSSDVFKQCEKNTCGMFGKNHGCPPKAGSEEERKARVMKYQNAFIINKILPISSRQEMQESMGQLKKSVNALREIFKENAILVLSTGPCDICDTCTALEDKPCRFPKRTLYSMEGCGIDVVRMSIDLNMTYNAGMGKAAFFALVLY